MVVVKLTVAKGQMGNDFSLSALNICHRKLLVILMETVSSDLV